MHFTSKNVLSTFYTTFNEEETHKVRLNIVLTQNTYTL